MVASWQEKRSRYVRVHTTEFGAASPIVLRVPSAEFRAPLSQVGFNRERALKKFKSVVNYDPVENTYTVERVITKRRFRSAWKYRVKWLGYPASQNTWEPAKK